jgi:hypothetical protein
MYVKGWYGSPYRAYHAVRDARTAESGIRDFCPFGLEKPVAKRL